MDVINTIATDITCGTAITKIAAPAFVSRQASAATDPISPQQPKRFWQPFRHRKLESIGGHQTHAPLLRPCATKIDAAKIDAAHAVIARCACPSGCRAKSAPAPPSPTSTTANWIPAGTHSTTRKQPPLVVPSPLQPTSLHRRQNRLLHCTDQPGSDELA